MSPVPSPPQRSPWPHRWAWLLACATFPLVWWGGLVTTTGSGMAFRDWLTSDGVLMPFYPWLSSTGEKFIEHGHRLLGMLAGMLTIALLTSLYLAEPRRWVRWFGVGLLAGVIAQGVLGGMRVVLNERVLALIHGCTGPLFFAACAAMVAVTSRSRASRPAALAELDEAANSTGRPNKAGRLDGLLRLAVLTAVLAYLQLVVGAVVRHSPLMHADGAAAAFQIAVYFHLVLAAAVTAHVLLLAHHCFWRGVCRSAAAGLALLVLTQLALGMSTWLVKYGIPRWAAPWLGGWNFVNIEADLLRAGIITSHGAVGALIVALCAVVAIRIGLRTGVAFGGGRLASAAPVTGAVG